MSDELVGTALVTGATSGLGRALVTELAHRAQVRGGESSLTVLVNNAGVGFGPPGSAREESADGHELRLAVNYLAPVALTHELLPLLRASAPSRIVNIGSLGQMPVDVDDLEFTRGYNATDAYRRAKLALAAWTFDLADQLRNDGVSVTCLHPATFMPTTMTDSGITPVATLEEGVRATLRLIRSRDVDGVTGEFFDGSRPARAPAQAYDPAFRARLREATDRLLAA